LLGSKIQTLRKNKNMTQAQLAEVLSVSSQSVSKWENNTTLPDISLLPVIARFFGVTMDELFSYRLDALNYKERFIRFMADNGMLRFGEFKRGTGETAPYCISIGNYKTGSQILKLGEFYADCINENNIQADTLFGPAYKGVPLSLAATLATYDKYGKNLNFCFDRKEVKDHGEGGMFVGKQLEDGEKVVIIEDVMTSGKALKEVLPKLKGAANVDITGMVITVDRMEKGLNTERSAVQDAFIEHGVKVYSIVTILDIIQAIEDGVIEGKEHVQAIKDYLKEYGANY